MLPGENVLDELGVGEGKGRSIYFSFIHFVLCEIHSF